MVAREGAEQPRAAWRVGAVLQQRERPATFPAEPRRQLEQLPLQLAASCHRLRLDHSRQQRRYRAIPARGHDGAAEQAHLTQRQPARLLRGLGLRRVWLRMARAAACARPGALLRRGPDAAAALQTSGEQQHTEAEASGQAVEEGEDPPHGASQADAPKRAVPPGSAPRGRTRGRRQRPNELVKWVTHFSSVIFADTPYQPTPPCSARSRSTSRGTRASRLASRGTHRARRLSPPGPAQCR